MTAVHATCLVVATAGLLLRGPSGSGKSDLALRCIHDGSGRLVADEETASSDVSTVEEEELSALMGEKEEYNAADEQNEEDWED